MSAIVTIKGVVTSTTVWKPKKGQEGEPHLRVDILQITGENSDIVMIKDDDLSTVYRPGQPIEITCFVSHYKTFLSYKVFRGDFKSFKLQTQTEKAA